MIRVHGLVRRPTAVDMAVFGEAKQEFPRQVPGIEERVRATNTFSRVFRQLDPDQFRAVFSEIRGPLRRNPQRRNRH